MFRIQRPRAGLIHVILESPVSLKPQVPRNEFIVCASQPGALAGGDGEQKIRLRHPKGERGTGDEAKHHAAREGLAI